MASSPTQNSSTFTGLTKGGSLEKFDLPVSCSIMTPTEFTTVSRLGGASLTTEKTEKPTVSVPGWKRVLDVVLILLTLPMWLPLMIVIGGWIKLCSTGPVFFRQERIGIGTKPFTILKFRSMKTGAETRSHENHFETLVESGVSMTKLDSLKDNRVIPGGRLLRVLGLDELPQLINVLRGEMSLVGPRPCLPKELKFYSKRQLGRFNSLPGITGYWQVNGKNKTTFNQMVEMDIQYSQRATLVFDLVIILGTVPALAMQAMESRWQRADERAEATDPSLSEAV